ncbi:MAG: aromatic amino acid lyase [Candidatus Marinimicrobia bacterium]|nr:aromatic amino acid lyase [Candidatus Neomarinimicrobiota bacterium]
MDQLVIDGNSLVLNDLRRFYYKKLIVMISEDSINRVEKLREIILKQIKSGKAIYGVNTGFDKLSNVSMKDEDFTSYDKTF